MNSEPVELVRVIRRMRGGSQAHLVEGNDGHFYVAKFKGNPQGNRTLINEWFAHELFRWFGISTPPLRVLRLTKAVQAISEDLVFQLGKAQVAVEPGLHLGSQCPANPATTAIFDFLPRKILGGVTNLEDFGKALVLDQFLGQADARQAIFIRERSGKGTWHFRAYLIDHGWMFGGSQWLLHDDPSQGLCQDRTLYSLFDLHAACEQALRRMAALTKEDLARLAEDVPRVWFSPGDEAEWARLLDRLYVRKSRLPQLVLDHLKVLDLSQQGKPARVSSQENTCTGGNLVELEQQASDLAVLPALG
jgi:hypothetical protein